MGGADSSKKTMEILEGLNEESEDEEKVDVVKTMAKKIKKDKK